MSFRGGGGGGDGDGGDDGGGGGGRWDVGAAWEPGRGGTCTGGEGRYMYGKGVKEEVPPSASRHLCRYKYRYRYR